MIFSITLLKVLMISLVYSNYRERLFSFISKFRYQKGITPQQKSRKVRYLCGFPAPCLLFKLNRPRWLTSNIIEAAVYPLHFIDNPAHNSL